MRFCGFSSIAVIEPPAPLLTASEVQTRLGISDDEAILSPLIAAVCGSIEPPNGWVGRAFGLQTLEQRGGWFADTWGGPDLRLRYPPFREIVSVKYLDSEGVETTLSGSGYEVIGAVGTDIARLVLPYGGAWPTARYTSEAVRIRYVAGYDHDDPQLDAAKSAVALAVRALLPLAKRDPALSAVNVPGVGSQNYIFSEASAKVLHGAVESLLQGYRVWH